MYTYDWVCPNKLQNLPFRQLINQLGNTLHHAPNLSFGRLLNFHNLNLRCELHPEVTKCNRLDGPLLRSNHCLEGCIPACVQISVRAQELHMDRECKAARSGRRA